MDLSAAPTNAKCQGTSNYPLHHLSHFNTVSWRWNASANYLHQRQITAYLSKLHKKLLVC